MKNKTLIVIISILIVTIFVIFFFFYDKNKINNEQEESVISKIYLLGSNVEYFEDNTYNLDVRVVDQKGRTIKEELEYISSDENILVFNPDHSFNTKKDGLVTITVRDKNKLVTKEMKIEVKKNTIDLEKLSFKDNDITLIEGDEYKYNLLFEPVDATNKEFSITSSDESILKISEDKFVALSSGEVVVTASSNNINATCNVKVNKKIILVNGITLNTNKLTLKEDETSTLTYTISNNNATDNKVIWESSDNNIATVENGVVKAHKVGKAIITIKSNDGNAKATCEVTVNEKDKLEVHFISHGGFYDDGILIRLSDKVIFIDGGRQGCIEYNNKYLDTLGIKKIDLLIGTHLDNDHIVAQSSIIENYKVEKMVYPDNIFSCNGCNCTKDDQYLIVNSLKKMNMKPEIIKAPYKIEVGELKLYFIAPTKLICNKNDNSLVFIMKYKNNSFIFTGDSYSPVQDMDTLKGHASTLGIELKADVIKYPHHGCDPIPKLISELKPKYVIVPNNGKSDCPSNKNMETLKNLGIKVYRQTDSETRNITLISDGTTIIVKENSKAEDYK